MGDDYNTFRYFYQILVRKTYFVFFKINVYFLNFGT